MRNVRKGIYPGSFDPLTNGHLDIIKRAAAVCDMLYVAVARNSAKRPLFSVEERLEIIKDCCPCGGAIEVVAFDGLLADFCSENGISIIFRGLRGAADFENESAVACVNSMLAPGTETLFLLAESGSSFISSSIVKEVASYGGDVSPLGPPQVIPMLKTKFSR
ncbi:MAG: pantetheine-phosphate adenylyltransferase [Spirochaetota bacterium]